MSSRQATAGYPEIIRGLLARAPTHSARGVDSLTDYGSVASSPDDEIVAEAREHDRGASFPARGIVISIIIGLALWGLAIGVLVAVVL